MTGDAFGGSIAAVYDRYLVPMVFEPYAAELARRISALRPARVLEIAAGTGVLTERLAESLPSGSTIVATDLSQPMLDRAALRLGASGVRFEAADAQSLPFADGEFDVAVCQFGVMFVPDKATAYAEMARVLRSGGHALFTIWDRLATSPIPHAVAEAVAARFPADPPRFLSRVPYGYHDVAGVRVALGNAGFGTVSAETLTLTSTAPSARDGAIGFCQGTPLRTEIETRDPDGLGAATTAAEATLIARLGPGPITTTMTATLITATAT
ncbi:MAG: hypothetical protein QOD41_1726 [Cryptosporangiaceae bacterium]|nr:hypothetical protein [Cryptosporangiaceae bacterium]